MRDVPRAVDVLGSGSTPATTLPSPRIVLNSEEPRTVLRAASDRRAPEGQADHKRGKSPKDWLQVTPEEAARRKRQSESDQRKAAEERGARAVLKPAEGAAEIAAARAAAAARVEAARQGHEQTKGRGRGKGTRQQTPYDRGDWSWKPK